MRTSPSSLATTQPVPSTPGQSRSKFVTSISCNLAGPSNTYLQHASDSILVPTQSRHSTLNRCSVPQKIKAGTHASIFGPATTLLTCVTSFSLRRATHIDHDNDTHCAQQEKSTLQFNFVLSTHCSKVAFALVKTEPALLTSQGRSFHQSRPIIHRLSKCSIPVLLATRERGRDQGLQQ